MSDKIIISAHAIFCDDIRHEVTNKISLIGTYGDIIYVEKKILLLPKLCVLVKVELGRGQETELTVQIKYGEQEYAAHQTVAPFKPEAPELETVHSVFAVEISPFKVEDDGFIMVDVVADKPKTKPYHAGKIFLKRK